MKKFLKEKCFANVKEVKQTKKTVKALKDIKIDEFKNCFEQWEKTSHTCIASDGEYFGDD